MEGGAAHGYQILCVSRGAPPPYIKEGGGRPLEEAHQGGGGILLGVGLPTPSRIPPTWRGREGRERWAAPPPTPSPIRIHGGGWHRQPMAAPLSFPYGPLRPNTFSRYSRNSPVLRKIPESLGTFPTSEYSLPIYRSLPLGHSETDRHVLDLIRDSELPSVTNHITHIILYRHRTLSVRTLRVRE